jgi:hypothetical protein
MVSIFDICSTEAFVFHIKKASVILSKSCLAN